MLFQGPLSPGTVVNDSSIGVEPWVNPENAKVSDDSYAVASNLEETVASHRLKATDFGFKIPAGATILGVKLEVERHASGAGTGFPDPGVYDWEVSLVRGGSVTGDNKIGVDLWPTVDTIESYGDDSDLWGLLLTPEDINISDFGISFRARGDAYAGVSVFPDAFVDHLQVTVYYEPVISRGSVEPKTSALKRIFSGDLLMTLGPDGSTLTFKGGQPVMDQGFETHVLIALFTKPGWAGNTLFRNPDNRIGSDFVDAANQPITLQSLTAVEQVAVRALQSPAFGRVTATATNPESNRLRVKILIEPPGQDSATIILTRNGQNWQAQASRPAHERL